MSIKRMKNISSYLAMTQILDINETISELQSGTLNEIVPDTTVLKIMGLLSEYRNLLCACMKRTELLANDVVAEVDDEG